MEIIAVLNPLPPCMNRYKMKINNTSLYFNMQIKWQLNAAAVITHKRSDFLSVPVYSPQLPFRMLMTKIRCSKKKKKMEKNKSVWFRLLIWYRNSDCVFNMGHKIKRYTETPVYFNSTDSFPLVTCFDFNLRNILSNLLHSEHFMKKTHIF